MKQLLITIARVLASIPRRIVRWCGKARDFIVECLPSSSGGELTTSAGLEADEAVELAQAREEQAIMAPKSESENTVQTVLRYAAAVVTGSRVPDVQDDDLRRWLADLTPEGARRIFKATPGQIAQHMKPRCPGDHLEGVPSLGSRPLSAAPVLDGSHVWLAALAATPKVQMGPDGEFFIPDEDQSTRLRAA